MPSKNNKRKRPERPTIHPQNKYADSHPDFALLASLYPSFEPFVFYSRDGHPRIDWTDFNATRELTRVLLLHDHSLNWYLVADITDVALEWAERNVNKNPHVSQLIEIRKVTVHDHESSEVAGGCYCGPPILLGVVREGEKFDFCMCNPPFFESTEEAGLNPKTSCGGTPEEMVCPGGEQAFITRMIEDSVVLKESFRWYTSMIGRKINLKFLTSKLRDVGVTIVKTTEFVQGQTCRWGLAWSFLPPTKKILPPAAVQRTNISFMLEVWMTVAFYLWSF
ncbi:unnamed protein product [Linum tenue]|uniref:U6 small nuclear RNA (adenine-(43)-N(6))-methyltransferase n=1 Tax=Linum tenue TaxID=586396 RepID=A0AAV0MGQ6_9ROSI|nr:unnamed protein product [Linum tenue]